MDCVNDREATQLYLKYLIQRLTPLTAFEEQDQRNHGLK